MAEEINGTNVQNEPQGEPQGEQTPSIEDLQAQIATLTAERDHLKEAISASNSDASKRKKEAQEWKDKYTATLGEQERKELQIQEERERLTAELADYKERERISTYKSKLMSVGYDDATASTMASSLPEGISEDFFAQQKSFLEAKEQEIKTKIINSQPGLSAGMPPSTQKEGQNDTFRKYFGLK